MAAAPANPVLILGVGNPLMGDDGAGIRAAELLEQCALPEHVTVQEIGTPGWGLGAWLEGQSAVVILDAVQMGLEPGAWKKMDLRESRLELAAPAFSLHQTDLAHGLLLAQELDLLPPSLTLYGIEPARLALGDSLSPQVETGLTEMVQSIVNDFQRNT